MLTCPRGSMLLPFGDFFLIYKVNVKLPNTLGLKHLKEKQKKRTSNMNGNVSMDNLK